MITTEGKSLQEVMDELASVMTKQGGACYTLHRDTGKPQCLYQDGAGNHCAVGWLLDESSPLMDYHGGIIGMEQEWEGEMEDLTNYLFIEVNRDVLMQIQNLHDARNLEDRHRHACYITEEFGIDMSAWKEFIEREEF